MMKKRMLVAVLMVGVIGIAKAQDKKYWVVETAATGNSIVKIYDANNKLVKETDVNRRIDVTRKRERKALNKMLRQNDTPLWSKR